MNWLRRLFRRPPELSGEHRAAIAAYQGLAAPSPAPSARATRFVVLDVESSGLNPFRDRLLSIGAVVVQGGVIRLEAALEVVLKQDTPSDIRNILVHGIDGAAQLGGEDPRAALLSFLAFAGKQPLVGYHVDFDRVMIERATKRFLGIDLANDWLDLARLVPGLFPKEGAAGRGLDYWLGVFGIDNAARHNALSDALASAQLLQVALARAEAAGKRGYTDLRRIDDDQGWLQRAQREPR